MSCPRSLSASSSPGLKWPCRCFCHLTTGVAWARGDRRGRVLLRGRGMDAFTHAGAATAHCACLVLQSPDHSFACSAPLQRLAPPLRIKTRYATPQAATVAVSATRPVCECTAHTTGNGPTPDGICRTSGAQPGAPHHRNQIPCSQGLLTFLCSHADPPSSSNPTAPPRWLVRCSRGRRWLGSLVFF